MENKRIKRCCFTGHRPEKLIISERDILVVENKIKELLVPHIKKAVADGYETFITGMARGFDMWAADIVLEEKMYNPNIHLICALPMDNFEARWSIKEQAHYHDILESADFIKTVSDYYYSGCFQARNEFMVNHSTRVIAAFNGTPGGTKNTINYAKRNNVEVINIFKGVRLDNNARY